MKAIVLALLLAAGSPAPSPSAAAPSPTPDAAQLAETRARLDEISRRLAAEKEKEKALLAEIDDLDHEIVDKQDDIKTLTDEAAKARAQSEERKSRMDEIRARISRKKHWLSGRLRSAYVHGRPGYLKVLFSAASYPELVRRTRFQAIIAHRDARLVDELKKDVEAIAKSREDYDQDLAILVSKESRARTQSDELGYIREFRKKLLDQIQGEAAGDEKLKDALQSAADRLAAEVGSLLGGTTATVAPGAKHTFVEGKGKLPRPVAAAVKLGFGPYKHPKLGLQMIHQGVSYNAGPGTEVHAIAEGTVEMSTWFSSYGQVVIVDHGDGWRSLYAHNAHLDVEKGAVVHEGELIAHSGDTGSLDGPELYFAIFREGKPVDPTEWLAK